MQVKHAMSPDVVTVTAQQTIQEALNTMTTAHVRRLPVMRDGTLAGIVTDDDLHRAQSQGESGSVADITRGPTITIQESADLLDAVRVVLQSRVGGLPVLNEEQQLTGMLTLTDILRAGAQPQWGPLGLVREHMTRTAITITPTAPASEASAYLTLSRLRVLPVVYAGVLVGVVRAQDLREAAEQAGAAHERTVMANYFHLQGKSVKDLMRTPQDTVLADAPLGEAMCRMLDVRVRGLPVVDHEGRLLGVITVSDVLTAMLPGQLEHA